MIDLFRAIDEDEDGQITGAELQAFMQGSSAFKGELVKMLALARPVKKGSSLFEALDVDHDSVVTQQEFCDALRVAPPPQHHTFARTVLP